MVWVFRIQLNGHSSKRPPSQNPKLTPAQESREEKHLVPTYLQNMREYGQAITRAAIAKWSSVWGLHVKRVIKQDSRSTQDSVNRSRRGVRT